MSRRERFAVTSRGSACCCRHAEAKPSSRDSCQRATGSPTKRLCPDRYRVGDSIGQCAAPDHKPGGPALAAGLMGGALRLHARATTGPDSCVARGDHQPRANFLPSVAKRNRAKAAPFPWFERLLRRAGNQGHVALFPRRRLRRVCGATAGTQAHTHGNPPNRTQTGRSRSNPRRRCWAGGYAAGRGQGRDLDHAGRQRTLAGEARRAPRDSKHACSFCVVGGR